MYFSIDVLLDLGVGGVNGLGFKEVAWVMRLHIFGGSCSLYNI